MAGRIFSRKMFDSSKRQRREKEWTKFEAEAMPLMTDIFRAANFLTRNRAEAEDLTRETFVQALKSFHCYAPETDCRARLMTILYHLSSKQRYNLGRLKLVEDAEEQIAATAAFVPSAPERLEEEEVLAALKKIPRIFREICCRQMSKIFLIGKLPSFSKRLLAR